MIFRRLCLAAGSMILALLLAEVILRIFFSMTHRSIHDYIPPARWSEKSFTSKFVSHPFLPYALSPGYRDYSQGRIITINEQGFRGADSVSYAKPPGEFRIACVGGSPVFGMGVDTATWPAFLERTLSPPAAGVSRVRVLNFGVEGYTTHSDLVQLSLRAVAYHPDAVIIYSGINDIKLMGAMHPLPDGTHGIRDQILLPQGIQRFVPNALLNHVVLVAVATRLFDRRVLGVEYGHMIMYWPFEEDPTAPTRGAEYLESNFRSMIGIARAHGIVPYLSTLVTHPSPTDTDPYAYCTRPVRETVNMTIRKIAREMNVPLMDPAADTLAWRPEYFIDAVHLSNRGNENLARYFANVLEKNKLEAPEVSPNNTNPLSRPASP